MFVNTVIIGFARIHVQWRLVEHGPSVQLMPVYVQDSLSTYILLVNLHHA